jgi:hypothetical protein
MQEPGIVIKREQSKRFVQEMSSGACSARLPTASLVSTFCTFSNGHACGPKRFVGPLKKICLQSKMFFVIFIEVHKSSFT